jgi:hypothetical protein
MFRPIYFDLEELVCPHVFNKYGAQAWSFLDPRLLQTLDVIREALDKPIHINTWHSGGVSTQSGFRCIQCDIVKKAIKDNILYVSAHMEGQAVDWNEGC